MGRKIISREVSQHFLAHVYLCLKTHRQLCHFVVLTNFHHPWQAQLISSIATYSRTVRADMCKSACLGSRPIPEPHGACCTLCASVAVVMRTLHIPSLSRLLVCFLSIQGGALKVASFYPPQLAGFSIPVSAYGGLKAYAAASGFALGGLGEIFPQQAGWCRAFRKKCPAPPLACL